MLQKGTKLLAITINHIHDNAFIRVRDQVIDGITYQMTILHERIRDGAFQT